MRREVPDHAHVLLVQAEVDARRGDEVDVAELAAVDEVAELAHRRAEHEGVAHHEREAGAVGEQHELLGVGRRARHRLLDEHVLAGLERRLGEREVRRDRRGDDHRVHGRVVEHLVVALRGGLRRVAAADLVERFRAQVADPLHRDARHFHVVAQKVRAPVPVPDDRYVRHAAPAGRAHAAP